MNYMIEAIQEGLKEGAKAKQDRAAAKPKPKQA